MFLHLFPRFTARDLSIRIQRLGFKFGPKYILSSRRIWGDNILGYISDQPLERHKYFRLVGYSRITRSPGDHIPICNIVASVIVD